jgi:AcrR family transcriptional regulator
MSVSDPANHFLFVAHPGHELCVHGWLSSTQPKVFVLTDGSGRGGQSRIGSTSKVLDEVGAQPGSIYGHFTDAELYELILRRDFQPLLRIIDEFADAIVTERPSTVAGDAIEGYNPSHDLCRLIINASVTIARRSGCEVVNRDFLLARPHAVGTESRAVNFELDDAAFARKLGAARAFPELQSEIEAALAGELLSFRKYPQLGSWMNANNGDSNVYRNEVLRLVHENGYEEEFPNEVPFYERYGELRVADGFYHSVIRLREHMVPLAEALRHFAERRSN